MTDQAEKQYSKKFNRNQYRINKFHNLYSKKI